MANELVTGPEARWVGWQPGKWLPANPSDTWHGDGFRRHLRQTAITASPAPNDDIAAANPVGTIAVWVRTAAGARRPIPQADDRRRVAFPCHAVLSYGIDCSRA